MYAVNKTDVKHIYLIRKKGASNPMKEKDVFILV